VFSNPLDCCGCPENWLPKIGGLCMSATVYVGHGSTYSGNTLHNMQYIIHMSMEQQWSGNSPDAQFGFWICSLSLLESHIYSVGRNNFPSLKLGIHICHYLECPPAGISKYRWSYSHFSQVSHIIHGDFSHSEVMCLWQFDRQNGWRGGAEDHLGFSKCGKS
jgi:hypothetical protein